MRKTVKLLILLAVAGTISALASFGVFAATIEQKIITSEPFTDDAKNHVPDETYEEDGVIYHLKSYEVIDSSMGERSVEVSDTIPYYEIARTQSIPQTATIMVKDPLTGKEFPAEVPLESTRYSNEKWSDGFAFDITVHKYDASLFQIGDDIVDLNIDEPFKGYEPMLLEFIGASDKDYIIDNIRWVSEPYVDAKGELVRDLEATGRMRTVDCYAKYSGPVELEPETAQAVKAVYEVREEPVEETETETLPEVAKEPEQKKGFIDWLRDLWFNSELRDWLNTFGFGKLIAGAIDLALQTPESATISLGTVAVLFFASLVMFITAFAQRRKKRRYTG